MTLQRFHNLYTPIPLCSTDNFLMRMPPLRCLQGYVNCGIARDGTRPSQISGSSRFTVFLQFDCAPIPVPQPPSCCIVRS